MTTITFPSTPRPQSMAWKLIQPTQVNISSWTGGRQVLSSGRAWWECQYSLPPIVGTENFDSWRAFLGAAHGATNDFQVPVDPTAQSSLTNTVLVNGAGQTGRSIATDGWPNSTTVLYGGQYVTIANQLLQLTQNVTSNGSGQATLTFAQNVRAAPADNAPVEYKNPYALMYLVDDAQWSVEAGYVYNLSLNLRESF